MVRPFAVVFVLLFPAPTHVQAQQLSAGASYALLSLTYPDQIPQGAGVWLAWDTAPSGVSLGVDLGLGFFPEDHPIIGRQMQLLAGARAGIRSDRVGLFGRVRPGFVHFSERFFAPDVVCILIFPPPESCLIDATNLAVDLGGTVEFYPSRRSLLRFDVGDALIRFSRGDRDAVWKHNLLFAAGAGLRF